MGTVGIRELRMRLGHYLRAVSQGKIFTVTSRGKPVARLVPVSPPEKTAMPAELEERMWELASEGILTWNAGNFRLPEPVAVNKGPELLSDLVVKGRG